jgi:predicted PhzF superfamily epimerase YddE/YHI9
MLRERGDLPTGGRITFRTPAGPLGVREEDGLLWLALAAAELTEDDPPADVLDALGVPAASWFGRNGAEYVVVLETADQVERARPNRERLLRLAVPRTVITALGGAGVDFTSRVFVPAWGLDEDQATGSAHAALAPLWARRLGRAQLKARQASRRGGTLALRLDADTVHIGADAVTVSRGSLLA